MNVNLTKKLAKKYPTLFQDIYGDPKKTCLAWGIETGDGWYKIIDNLCKKLEPLCVAENKKLGKTKLKQGYGFRASQIKEKYGTLRFYMSFETDEIRDLIDETEAESSRTCEICGKPGILRGFLPWVATLCTWHMIRRLKHYDTTGKVKILWGWLCSKF